MIRALALLALGGAVAQAAPPPPLAELVQKVDAAKASTSTLAGQFTQQNRVKLFKQELTSEGRMYFEKPRHIRWEYTAPDPSTLILDGSRATLFAPGAPAQVFDLDKDATMRAIFDQLLMWLGPGTLQKSSEYTLSTAGSAAAPVLVLTPKAGSLVGKAFSRIALRLDPKRWLARSILLVEKSGDEKEIVFTKLQRNVKLQPDAFSPPR